MVIGNFENYNPIVAIYAYVADTAIGDNMVTTRHKARKELMFEHLETCKDEKLKSQLTRLWDMMDDDEDDSEMEKVIWDGTRVKLADVENELLAKMKNAGSIETVVGKSNIDAMREDLKAFGDKFKEYCRQRGKDGKYAAFDEDNTFEGEFLPMLLSRLEKAIDGGYKLD